jgi:SRSO17 transposase
MKKEKLNELSADLDTFLGEFGGCFKTGASRAHLGTYVRGQLGPLERKSIEPIALDAGVAPRTLQEFVSLHRWDETAMRRRVGSLVMRDHSDSDAIGVIDETSYAKKGGKTVGVQRQHCGATGKVDNCVQTVHLSYVAPDFSAIVDSDVFLPESWATDPARRKEAGVPESVVFRKKWEIALDLLARTLADGVRLRWIVADEFYGRVTDFLKTVEARGLLYVVEIPIVTWGWTARGFERGRRHRRIDALFPRGGTPWIDYRVKETTKGPIVWRARAVRFRLHTDPSQERWLIFARNPITKEKKYFLSNAPADTPIEALLAIAFTRWHVERNFEDLKMEIGLDHFEVRKYRSLQRHLALSMVSLLFLTRAARGLGGEKGEDALDPRSGANALRHPDRATALATSSAG